MHDNLTDKINFECAKIVKDFHKLGRIEIVLVDSDTEVVRTGCNGIKHDLVMLDCCPENVYDGIFYNLMNSSGRFS